MGNKSYQEGYRARQNGEPRENNPYPNYSTEYYNWNNGWDYADRRENF